MTTITRERAELKSFITGFLSDPVHDNQSSRSMTAEVFRIALASMEAEPVLNVQFKNGWPVDGTAGIISGSPGIADGYHDFYTAPPAPVVQLQEWTNEQCLEFLSIAFRHAEIKGNLELDDIRLGVKMVNGSCTAMQGSSRTNGG